MIGKRAAMMLARRHRVGGAAGLHGEIGVHTARREGGDHGPAEEAVASTVRCTGAAEGGLEGIEPREDAVLCPLVVLEVRDPTARGGVPAPHMGMQGQLIALGDE